MARNLIRGGIGGYLIPVCIPVGDIPPVPTGTEQNGILNYALNSLNYTSNLVREAEERERERFMIQSSVSTRTKPSPLNSRLVKM
jgi:hypothetical protein